MKRVRARCLRHKGDESEEHEEEDVCPQDTASVHDVKHLGELMVVDPKDSNRHKGEDKRDDIGQEWSNFTECAWDISAEELGDLKLDCKKGNGNRKDAITKLFKPRFLYGMHRISIR